MSENNEKKRMGRRYLGWTLFVLLITVAFYVCLSKGIDFLPYFEKYAMVLGASLVVIVPSLTATDIWGKKFGK